MSLTNAQLSELLLLAAREETIAHRQAVLARAARLAFYWPVEASSSLGDERSLTELRGVGPWIARRIRAWLEDPPAIPEPDELRRGFLTYAEARAIVSAHPEWQPALSADHQLHTTETDGTASLREMAEAAAALERRRLVVTDHSRGLRIARGMDEDRLARQALVVAEVNAELSAGSSSIHVFHGLEMNLSPEGAGDMSAEALAPLDLVLGAFHSHLRVTEDQTQRYLRGLANPHIHVLAHPRGRRFAVRYGLRADWARIAQRAAELDVALEIDAHPTGRTSTSRRWPSCARPAAACPSARMRIASRSLPISRSAWPRRSARGCLASGCSTR